jgi:hypothetical protein
MDVQEKKDIAVTQPIEALLTRSDLEALLKISGRTITHLVATGGLRPYPRGQELPLATRTLNISSWPSRRTEVTRPDNMISIDLAITIPELLPREVLCKLHS